VNGRGEKVDVTCGVAEWDAAMRDPHDANAFVAQQAELGKGLAGGGVLTPQNVVGCRSHQVALRRQERSAWALGQKEQDSEKARAAY
jgi:hypothetical protein